MMLLWSKMWWWLGEGRHGRWCCWRRRGWRIGRRCARWAGQVPVPAWFERTWLCVVETRKERELRRLLTLTVPCLDSEASRRMKFRTERDKVLHVTYRSAKTQSRCRRIELFCLVKTFRAPPLFDINLFLTRFLAVDSSWYDCDLP